MPHKKTVGFIGGKFLPLHLGHLNAIVQASKKVDELYVVLSSSKNRDRAICDRGKIKYIPAEVRLSWLGESLKKLKNVKIIHIEDDQWNNNYDWSAGADMIKKAIGKPIDFVFSSEEKYDKIFKKYYSTSKHILIDKFRKKVNISATEIRNNLYKYWDKMPENVRNSFVIKVVIVGTESCGKSTLTKQLAKHYHTNYVREIGRDYCNKHSNYLTKEMFDDIAMKHFLEQKQKLNNSNKLLFVDTEAVITQYYLNMYFKGEKSKLIEELIKKQNFDLVLYLEPDVDWVNDGLRFAGKKVEREKNNVKLKNMYQKRGIKFNCINGTYDERLEKAKKMIDKLINKKQVKI